MLSVAPAVAALAAAGAAVAQGGLRQRAYHMTHMLRCARWTSPMRELAALTVAGGGNRKMARANARRNR
eukprot:7548857-Alexandrium_andersonii.AAC.1